MKRFFWFGRRHPVFIVSLVFAVVATSGTAAWAVSYDNVKSNRLLPGTLINGIPVGGLSFDAAVAKVSQQVEAPLHRPITIAGTDFEATTTAWDLGLHVDIASVVRRAMEPSKQGNLLERVWHQLFSQGPTHATAVPKWGDGALGSILDQAATTEKVDPKDASLSTATGWVSVTPAKVGRSLDVEASRAAVLDAVRLNEDTARLVTDDVQPDVGSDAFSKVILVRTGENKLYLYDNGSISSSWSVATGTSEFQTPLGTFRVVSKLVNPTWTNPKRSWSASMPATIPGGPGNPLGTHALALNTDGILIHATSDDASIGYSASHGCIRMHESDEASLFGQVGVGTPVAIVEAGPPKPRGATVTPAPADPAAAAAVQY